MRRSPQENACLLFRFDEQRPTGTRLDIGTVELVELDCLTARINELRPNAKPLPKGRIGWMREIDSQILTSKPNVSSWSGILRVKSYIVCRLGQTVAIMSMSFAWGMLGEI